MIPVSPYEHAPRFTRKIKNASSRFPSPLSHPSAPFHSGKEYFPDERIDINIALDPSGNDRRLITLPNILRFSISSGRFKFPLPPHPFFFPLKMPFNALSQIRDPIIAGLTSFDGCSAGNNGIWHERRLLLLLLVLLLCLELGRRIADRREVLFPKRDVIYFSPLPRETRPPSDIPWSREGVPGYNRTIPGLITLAPLKRS